MGFDKTRGQWTFPIFLDIMGEVSAIQIYKMIFSENEILVAKTLLYELLKRPTEELPKE